MKYPTRIRYTETDKGLTSWSSTRPTIEQSQAIRRDVSAVRCGRALSGSPSDVTAAISGCEGSLLIRSLHELLQLSFFDYASVQPLFTNTYFFLAHFLHDGLDQGRLRSMTWLKSQQHYATATP